MSNIHPLYTKIIQPSSLISEEDNALYIYHNTGEERTEIENLINKKTTLVDAKIQNNEIVFIYEKNKKIFYLFNKAGILDEISSYEVIYIDITGLDYRLWAPIMKICLENNLNFYIVYAEPESYRRKFTSFEGDLYDLREEIEGIRPLPLFSSLSLSTNNDFYFIPILGFEGSRFSYMANDLEPTLEDTIPIIGSPGFLPHYVFESLKSNSYQILQLQAQHRIFFSKANCPISIFYTLEKIKKKYSKKYIKIGILGTRPHSVGAILFHLLYKNSEIIYDNVVFKERRTNGVLKRFIYDVSQFWKIHRETL